MSEPADLFKVALKYSAIASEPPPSHIATMFFNNVDIFPYIVELNRGVMAQRLQHIMYWLARTGREAHYVNSYDQSDHRAGEGRFVVVLSDRDTALLLKLTCG